MRRYLFIMLSLFLSSIVTANVPVDSMISICSTYPELNDPTSLPLRFNSTNNLARPKDSAFYQAEGEKITIYGRVLDSNCTPVSDAKIFIWQANKKGDYQYELKSPSSKHHHHWIDPNFSGTGITNSDNLGRFNFTTIKPGSHHKITPHIHIMVVHPKLKKLTSKIFFPTTKKIIDTNINDKVYIITKPEEVALVSAIPSDKNDVYLIDITMGQELLHKGY